MQGNRVTSEFASKNRKWMVMIEMPREAREKSETGNYHIIWRGANKQEIFHDDLDSRKFLDILKNYKIKCALTVHAWCLMGNHAHLLVKEGNEDISVTMKRIGVSYAGYYNRKYITTGHLFQDRFRSENVDNNRYFRTVVRYIHQNPVKAGIVHSPSEWKWSSCLGYYGKGLYPENLLDSSEMLGMISTDTRIARDRFKEFNERKNHDQCLEDQIEKKGVTDEEARLKIMEVLGEIEIPQVKSLPKEKRKEVLRKVKKIDRISLRQTARILGVSVTLIFKA
ncbi:transposase [Schinkia sp. CFF1]